MSVSYLLCTSGWGALPLGTISAPQSRNTQHCGWPLGPGLQPQPSPDQKRNISCITQKLLQSINFYFYALKIVQITLKNYLWTAGRYSHACACSFHQSPLVSWQQVVLHGLNQVVFTRTAILNQRLLLHTLTHPNSNR